LKTGQKQETLQLNPILRRDAVANRKYFGLGDRDDDHVTLADSKC